jgi:hypothetical protein
MEMALLKYYRYDRKMRVYDLDGENCVVEWRDVCYNDKDEIEFSSEVEQIETTKENVEIIKDMLKEQFEELRKFAQAHPDFYPIPDTMQ